MKEIIAAILAFLGIFTAPPAQTTTVKPSTEVNFAGRTYVVHQQEIAKNLTLIPNFERQKTSSQIMEDCRYGSNGGFYTQDNKPIGLFIASGKQTSAYKRNSTLNGFFVYNGQFSITRNPPASAEFAVQSGPYITVNLRLQNDTFARRVLVARSKNQWYFLAITEKDNVYDGPKLTELPEILAKINIDEALNLDGGSASAFYSESGVRLGELTPVGSFFCGK